MNAKPIKVFYAVILPVITICLLLGIASVNHRSYLLGSWKNDFFIRLLLAIWFSGLYIRLSKIGSYSIYPNRKWEKADVKGGEKFVYLGIGLIFAFAIGFITWQVSQWFFPSLSIFSVIVSVVNSLIVFLPVSSNSQVFKL